MESRIGLSYHWCHVLFTWRSSGLYWVLSWLLCIANYGLLFVDTVGRCPRLPCREWKTTLNVTIRTYNLALVIRPPLKKNVKWDLWDLSSYHYHTYYIKKDLWKGDWRKYTITIWSNNVFKASRQTWHVAADRFRSHNFIFKTLDFLNFGPSFRNWIKIFYNKRKSLSNQFDMGRGCRL